MTQHAEVPVPPARVVVIVEYDPRWPSQYEEQERRIRSALGDRALLVEHAYRPDLEAAGYALRFREPDWYEHRFFRGSDPAVNLHVFTAGCEEVERMLAFRDRLRADESDRLLYERTKRGLAGQDWAVVQDYADAKTDVVADIVTRSRFSPTRRQ